MWINVCYHRIRIRVKLTCDEMRGSVGAGANAQRLRPTLALGKPLVRLKNQVTFGRILGASRTRRSPRFVRHSSLTCSPRRPPSALIPACSASLRNAAPAVLRTTGEWA
jgi:hypothetical protein